MKAKIRVYGKSQSRTALGIVNAYLKLNPNSTLADLQRVFPGSLNPKSFTDHIIVPQSEALGHEKMFFEREDELVVLKNGQKLALVEVWTKEDYDAICEHARQYGIVVAEMEETTPFEKGSYKLEFLEDFTPPVAPLHATTSKANGSSCNQKENCCCKKWWWLLALLLLLLLLIFLFRKCSCSGKEALAPVVAEEVKKESIFDRIKGKMDELSGNFIYDTGDTVTIKFADGKELRVGQNSTEYQLFSFLNSDKQVDPNDKTTGWITLDRLYFETGKANLTAESENQLKNIAYILGYFPNAHIKMGGYTDNTGTEEINMKLSVERAKVAAEKLVGLGVDAARVSHEGYGQQHPVCPENDTPECRALNRRIDIRVTQK